MRRFFATWFSALLLFIVALPSSATDRAELLRANLLHNRKYVTVVCHRGDWRGAPENSLQAYQNCIDMGADMIEIDLQMTKDSVLVVMHDRTLDRTSTGKGKIADHTLAELRDVRLKAGDGQPTRHTIPTLEEVLTLCKGKILINIDKGYDYFRQVYALMEQTGTTEQVIIKSGKRRSVVEQENGDVLAKTIYMPIVSIDKPGAEEIVDEWLAAHPVAMECCIGTCNEQAEQLLAKLRASDTQIWINSLWPSLCDSHDDDRAVELHDPDGAWGWILDKGATIIQCERPRDLIAYLKAHGRHRLKKAVK